MDLFIFSRLWQIRWTLPIVFALSMPLAFAQELPTIADTKLKYLSVFSQYQTFNEQPVLPWRETNNRVEKNGGWRIYAKEAMLSDTDEKATVTVAPSDTEIHKNHGRKP